MKSNESIDSGIISEGFGLGLLSWRLGRDEMAEYTTYMRRLVGRRPEQAL